MIEIMLMNVVAAIVQRLRIMQLDYFIGIGIFSSLDMDVTFMELFRFVILLVVEVRLTNHEP